MYSFFVANIQHRYYDNEFTKAKCDNVYNCIPSLLKYFVSLLHFLWPKRNLYWIFHGENFENKISLNYYKNI